jgi:hypothetical protein
MMMLDYSKHLKKRNRVLSELSGSFMSNSKWLKLFKTLSSNHDLISKCFITDIYEDRRREFGIPTIESFNEAFDDAGIKDGQYGPMLFKEIHSVEFPAQWSVERKMRDQLLQSFVYGQNLNSIHQIIMSVGEFVVEKDDNCLIIVSMSFTLGFPDSFASPKSSPKERTLTSLFFAPSPLERVGVRHNFHSSLK